ncbi:hypothetical protein HYDPIDRAFT_33179 [Hydnomerulius pinastri MD-312]|uniref:DUF6534 domain-containing protein n=1 Tax=Hydnomerulius pinastri MD-312 TaxID=994086 RepID=A0A0C9W9F1_9AGAM|nr:hypothetical protein HYDPIDRAFT_33179 [Hydnomerulius pinastri MD-312]
MLLRRPASAQAPHLPQAHGKMNATSVPLLFPPVDLSSNIGTGYWGLIGASVLLGCTVLQAYFYFRNNNDGWTLKGLVITLCALDTLSWAFFAYVYYYYLVKNFGNDLVLLSIPWPFGAEIFAEVIVTFLSQLFFAWQIYRVNKKGWPISVVIVVLALVAFAVAVLSVEGRGIAFIASKTLSIPTDINKGFATACDIIATLTMCYMLSTVQTTVARTRSVITLLIIYTINRGILLALIQGADLILYICAAAQDYWVPFHMCLSKVYVNTLLAMLNARSSLKKKRNEDTGVTLGETHDSSNYSSAAEPQFVSRMPAYEPSARSHELFGKSSAENFNGPSATFAPHVVDVRTAATEYGTEGIEEGKAV